MFAFPHNVDGKAALVSLEIAAINVLYHYGRYLASKLWRPSQLIGNSSLWLNVALTLDFAIEFPLILWFHPATLQYPRDVFSLSTAPSVLQSILQIAIFFAVEVLLEKMILRFISVVPNPENGEEMDPEDATASRLVFDFIRPRGTLLIVVTVLSVPSRLTLVTGQVHVASMAWWAVLQQAIDWRPMPTHVKEKEKVKGVGN